MMKIKGSWIAASGIALALALATGALLWILRFDVTVLPNGASVSRDRITGEVQICDHMNICRKRAATPFQRDAPTAGAKTPEAAFLEAIQAKTDNDLHAELQSDSNKLRSEKDAAEKFLDLLTSAALGMMQPGLDASDLLLGEPFFEDKKGWKGAWGFRTHVEFAEVELRRQSSNNSMAMNAGYGVGLLFIMIAFAAAMRKIARRVSSSSLTRPTPP